MKRVLVLTLVLGMIFNVANVSVYAQESVETAEVEVDVTSKISETTTNEIGNWDQITTESVFEGENYRVIFTLNSYWNDGYNASIKLENIGENTIQNWYLSFDYSSVIANIWNAEISTTSENKYVIKNIGWNKDIAAGDSIEFGISGNQAFKGFPENYEIIGSNTEVKEEDYTIKYNIDGDWDTGFYGSISITNNTDTVIEDWFLEFDFDREITEIWDGVIENHEGNHYLIKNAGYNANIYPEQTVSFGFKGSEGSKEDEPMNYSLSSSVQGKDDNVEISIDTDAFDYVDSVQWYIVDEEIAKLTGTLTNVNAVKTFSYEIKNLNETIVKSDSITICENWTIEDFGLSIGYNKVVINAVLKDGKNIEIEMAFMNYSILNMDNLSLDLSDSDGDGLSNYYEDLLKTDKNNSDTDGDGLSDYDEFIYIGTSPTLKDTDNNGITDDLEDIDSDGLNNISEIEYKTNPFLSDTDGDGLLDGEEVWKYFTNPLIQDTDEDGLKDGEDVALSFDPANPDTNGNGVLDGDEIILQTYTQDIDTVRKAGISNVSVSLECNGFINNRVNIIDTYNLDMRSSDVVGLIGVPVEISADVDFETADIVFSYDEEALGETSEDDLCMMWYDEENDNYVLLEDCILDKAANTITYTTTHFSTYLVVDKQIWLDTMRMDLNYRNVGDITYYDLALVVDVSGSMRGTRINTAKKALNSFIEAMMEKDKAGIVKFSSSATIVQSLTSDKTTLLSKINSLSASGGTNANVGIQKGIDLLNGTTDTNKKMLILICDGDISYNATIVKSAKEKGIIIHCINVVNGSSTAMEKIASETGGIYYYAATASDIEKVISELTGETVEAIDMTDSDGDGLYDVYEVNGMRLSNGQIVYTDPNSVDTDGDGISDYDAMGGEPIIESYILDGNVYSCTLNHSNIYGKLSNDFIYVDGTLNTNGEQYYGKMEYIPYSKTFLDEKYQKEFDYTFGEESRTVYGDAGIYNSFSDKLATMKWYQLAGYAAVGTYTTMAVSLLDTQASYCLYTYVLGDGGSYEGLVEGSTREYIYATPRLGTNIFGINSANEHFLENMNKARMAAESVLNEYNTEVYISLSPDATWRGCAYNDCTGTDWHQNIDSILNIGAFGIYNNADAGITMHCVYNPDTEEYSMEFIYYIIDLYDFTLYDTLDEMNALGLARCYELYGVAGGETTWKADDSYNNYWMY